MQSILILSASSPIALNEDNTPAAVPRMIPSQGSRLAPGDYTNHVPILIDENEDFDFLGFQGEGTQNDPYVISSLNITADYGPILLRIFNIDAYFTVVDCYFKQGADDIGIHLENTSHATIEHVTIDSNSYGVVGINSNNTLINSNHITGIMQAVIFMRSHDCRISNNYMESQFCCYLVETVAFNLENNVYNVTGSGIGIVVDASYNTNSFLDQVFSEHEGVRVGDSINFSMSGALVQSYGPSIQVDTVYGLIIDNCTIESETDVGIAAYGCPNIKIQQSIVNGPVCGVHTFLSNHTQILDNTISGTIGIDVNLSNYSIVQNNTINSDSGYGISIHHCYEPQVISNQVYSALFGMAIVESNNSLVMDNTAQGLEVAIYVRDSKNCTITKNSAQDSVAGIFVRGDLPYSEVIVSDNNVRNCSGYGIYVDNYANVTINNNTVSDVSLFGIFGWPDGSGFYLEDCESVIFENNTAYDCITGLYIEDTSDVFVRFNHFWDMEHHGIFAYSGNQLSFISNTISDCIWAGIWSYWVTESGFENNILSNCGFLIRAYGGLEYYNHTFDNNTVNDLPVYHGFNSDGLSLDGSLYGQIILINTTDCSITGGSVVNAPLHIIYSNRTSVTDYSIRQCWFSFFIGHSDNTTISGLFCDSKESIEQIGGYIMSSDGFEITNSIFGGTTFQPTGHILVESSSNGTFQECIFQNAIYGLDLGDSDFIEIEKCNFTNFEEYGIYGGNSSHFGSIIDNYMYNTTMGVSVSSSNWTITNNEIHHSSLYGIYVDGDSYQYGTIEGNLIESCKTGIFLEDAVNWTVHDNMIRWSTDCGLNVTTSSYPNITENTIALSGIVNGYDDVFHYWDDTVSVGNYWYDFTPPGIYTIPGPGGAQDRYPMQYIVTEPIINQLMDISYAEGTLGNTLTWNPADNALRDWQVTIDGEFWTAAVYNYENVTVNIDGLSYGNHTLVITIWDVDQQNVTDEVIIHVHDATPPTISNVGDFVAFVNAEGQTLTWEVDDVNPTEYDFYVDDEIIETGIWTSGLLEVNIDGQTEGMHVVVMMVYDIDGNVAFDSIMVLFIDDDITPILDSPDDIIMDYGTLGNSIVWTPVDEYPTHYIIMANESTIISDIWSGSRIILNLDNLEVGTYDFELTVVDGSGLQATDTVRVTVLAPIPGTPTFPIADLGIVVVVGAVAGAIVVVILMVYAIKKRKMG